MCRCRAGAAAVVVLVAAASSAACGSAAPLLSVPLHPTVVLCGVRSDAASALSPVRPGRAREMAAALLATTVTVVAGPGGDSCMVLQPGHPAVLRHGDRAQFVANEAPDVTARGPDPVRVSTAPGPTSAAGGLGTTHVVVTLTAVRPGTASVSWIDCSGVGC